MLRWLVLAVAVFAAIWLLRRSLAARDQRPPAGPRDDTQAALVSCAHCGVHLPRGEALARGTDYYCSDAHRRLGPAS